MLPPVLELYVLWHPDDVKGRRFSNDVMHHFHGRRFTGLIGGSIDVFLRSAPASDVDDSPRAIEWSAAGASKTKTRQSDLIVLVPCLSLPLGRALLDETSGWKRYLSSCIDAANTSSDHVIVLPAVSDIRALDSSILTELSLKQEIVLRDEAEGRRENCRDLAQAIAQKASGAGERLTVFISHTKLSGKSERGVSKLVRQVRGRVQDTRLQRFFDTTDLQVGEDWASALQDRAGRSALLALRTDLYASRTWCQREMRLAKKNGMPVVVLDALTNGEERGSFLMDHVPRVSLHRTSTATRQASIDRALTLLVDESLKRVLWRRQELVTPATEASRIDWWAPHAPEPSTLTEWIADNPQIRNQVGERALRILHPDPPLGPDERDVLDRLAQISGFDAGVEVMTPAMLSARLDQPELALLPDDALQGVKLSMSVSESPDLGELGLAEEHLRLALGEVARMILVFGGSLAYGGHLDPKGYAAFLAGELQRFGRGERRLMLTLPWSEHRRLDVKELEERENALGLLAEVIYLDPDGAPMARSAGRGRGARPEAGRGVRSSALSAMREFQLSRTDAHLVLGGRRTSYQGRLPGVLEEALLSFDKGKPLFVAGGFGGVARDIAVALGLIYDDASAARTRSNRPETLADLDLVKDRFAGGDLELGNGLSSSENEELAGTPRAGRVAALVALGLARLQRYTSTSDRPDSIG